MRIGIFDSGIGGLTVLKVLRKNHPGNHYIYVGDTANLPYGEKTKEQLCSLSCHIMDFLIEKKVDYAVIACGTISSNVYEILKRKYPIPIQDIISPTISYIEKKYKKIALFATPMTIKSKAFTRVLKSKNISVLEQDCPKFVPLLESGQKDSQEMKDSIREYAKKIISSDVEALILGCTHYPIIEESIREEIPQNIDIVNMGIVLSDMVSFPEEEAGLELYFSKIDNMLLENVNYILEENVNTVVKEW